MRMGGQTIVGMRWDLMIMLARLIHGVDMHCHPPEHLDMVEQLMADFLGHGMPLNDRQGRANGNI